MAINPNTHLFTELDAVRMHGPAEVPKALVDRLGLIRGDKLIIEAIEQMLAMKDPTPDQLRDAGGVLLQMFSKTRMSEVAAVQAPPGMREGAVTDFIQKLGVEFREAFKRIPRNQIDALATILMATGDIGPLLMQIEMEQSLAPPRLANTLKERAAQGPQSPLVQIIPHTVPVSAPAPMDTVLPTRTERMVEQIRAAFVETIDRILDPRPNLRAGIDVMALREASSHGKIRDNARAQILRPGLTRKEKRKLQPLLQAMAVRTIEAQGEVLSALAPEKREQLYERLHVLSALPFLVDMDRGGDLNWPAPLRAELRSFDDRKAAQGPHIQKISPGDGQLPSKSEQILENLVRSMIAHRDSDDAARLQNLAGQLAYVSSEDFLRDGPALPPADFDKMLVQHKKTHETVFSRFSPEQRVQLFYAIHKSGAADTFKKIIDDGKSVWPPAVQNDFRSWMAARAPDIRAADIKVVAVERLLPPGAETPTDIVHRRRTDAATPVFAGAEPRVEWLIEGLKADGFQARDMVLYREKPMGPDKAQQAYVVLAVKGQDASGKAHDFQIAVCPVKGHATYILRRPVDFETQTRTIAELKADDTVFQSSCYTKEQWLRNVRSYATTELSDLQTQLKTRIGWHDKKDALIESFRAFSQETRQIPLTHDNGIIEHGPLAKRATWARAYTALQSKSIAGLEHVRTFKDLAGHVLNAGTVTPRVRKTGPAMPMNAQALFNGLVTFLSEQPERMPANDDRIAGKRVADINRSFRDGKVSGIEQVLPPQNGQKPSSIQEFMLAVGLAKTGENGSVSAVTAPMVWTIKRLIHG